MWRNVHVRERTMSAKSSWNLWDGGYVLNSITNEVVFISIAVNTQRRFWTESTMLGMATYATTPSILEMQIHDENQRDCRLCSIVDMVSILDSFRRNGWDFISWKVDVNGWTGQPVDDWISTSYSLAHNKYLWRETSNSILSRCMPRQSLFHIQDHFVPWFLTEFLTNRLSFSFFLFTTAISVFVCSKLF